MKPKSMKDYQCEGDAHSLMAAHEIMSDPKRHGKAKKQLDRLHKEKADQALHAKAAKGLNKVFADHGSV